MKTLVGVPLVIFGIGWMATVGLIYGMVRGVADIGAYFPIGPFFAIGPVALVIGVLFIVLGRADARRTAKEINHITADGVAAQGSVTFVDNNYNILVGDAPIFSIVEFTFRDGAGQEHTSRKEQVSRELVIRNKIEVGSQVNLMYLPANPDENVLLLSDPRAVAQTAPA